MCQHCDDRLSASKQDVYDPQQAGPRPSCAFQIADRELAWVNIANPESRDKSQETKMSTSAFYINVSVHVVGQAGSLWKSRPHFKLVITCHQTGKCRQFYVAQIRWITPVWETAQFFWWNRLCAHASKHSTGQCPPNWKNPDVPVIFHWKLRRKWKQHRASQDGECLSSLYSRNITLRAQGMIFPWVPEMARYLGFCLVIYIHHYPFRKWTRVIFTKKKLENTESEISAQQ